jgi:hypothetical protein
MQLHARIRTAMCVGLGLTALSCAGSPAKVEGPSQSASASPTASAQPTPAAKQETAPSEPAKSGPSAREVLARDGVLYSVAFEDSDIGKKAADSCAKESAGDPKKRASCMAKAREKLDLEGIQFTQDKEGAWWWLTLRRKGKQLITIHKIRFQFGEETPTGITIKTEGKDIGSSPGRLPASVSFEVPSDYRISGTDPKYGKLIYDAKMLGTTPGGGN